MLATCGVERRLEPSPRSCSVRCCCHQEDPTQQRRHGNVTVLKLLEPLQESLKRPKNVAKCFDFIGIGSALVAELVGSLDVALVLKHAHTTDTAAASAIGSSVPGAAGGYLWSAICGIVGGKVDFCGSGKSTDRAQS
ncbi:hypothetical protein AeRB84_000283 [Aphanomyces euteiches]|nr:hypothetical protein AeRB84_000283 [Aphanomyces euteiches]